MGQHCDLYDIVASKTPLVDWSDPDMTIKVLKLAFLSAIAVLIFSWLVPVNYIFLGLGIGVFVSNVAVVRAAGETLPPVR